MAILSQYVVQKNAHRIGIQENRLVFAELSAKAPKIVIITLAPDPQSRKTLRKQ
jgi:hypothetical protein